MAVVRQSPISGLLDRFMNWLDPLASLDIPVHPELSYDNAKTLIDELQWTFVHHVKSASGGDYRSLELGTGLDFDHLREYTHGDDIRKIDWNVFARTFSPHIKEYMDEEDVNAWIVLDLTPSMFFGKTRSKADLAVELTALIGMLMIRQHCKLGMVIIDGQQSHVVQPKRGMIHLQYALQHVLDLGFLVEEYPMSETKIADEVYEELKHLVRRRSIVFLLSDFFNLSERGEKAIGELSRTSTLFSFCFTDSAENEFPHNMGLARFFDPESGELMVLDTDNKENVAHLRKQLMDYRDTQFQWLKRWTTTMDTPTDKPAVDVLVAFLRRGRS